MLRLAYYADDFTGATDALETLALAGLKTRLFLTPPTPAQCAGLDAVGVAGLTRSLAPDAMERALRPAFQALKALAPRHVHYKVCSTFDSSPSVGSIGRAIDVGAGIFGGRTVPLLVAAPALGRYCVFGHLFARYGIGSDGAIFRLDRHPSVSTHPVTPMTESDLRVHLAHQTRKKVGLITINDLERPIAELRSALQTQVTQGAEIVLIDGMNPGHLERAGALLEDLAGPGTLFSVGSSGVGSALCLNWKMNAPASERPPARPAGSAAVPTLILSGSCSPVTAGQIDWALTHGFGGVALDPLGHANPASIAAALRSGRSVIAYTSRGQTDGTVAAEALGTMLGRLARDVVVQSNVKRVVIAGGDTSSYAARALGLESLEMLAPLSPGAPLCRAHAPGSPVDGLEVNFKGGQVGAPDYFGKVQAS
jgi:uncharacterized protein YgbK (DUF1537 family)